MGLDVSDPSDQGNGIRGQALGKKRQGQDRAPEDWN